MKRKTAQPPVILAFCPSGAFAMASRRFAMANSKASEAEHIPALGIATPLTNRKADGSFSFPADNWYVIAPFGDHPYEDPKNYISLIQVIDRIATEAMVNALIEGEEPLIDFEHWSHKPDGDSSAAGWIQALRTGEKGLEAQIRWSADGKTALANGRYRYISPVWLARDCVMLDDTRIRPLRINDAGLTNVPRLKNMPSLSNRDLMAAVQSHAGDETESADQTETNTMKKVNAELGISADATEDAAVAEIQKLKNSASEATTLRAENLKLSNSNKTLLNSQVKSDLDLAGLPEGSEERTAFETQLLANRDGALPLLSAFVKARGNAAADTLTNRQGAKTPEQKKAGAAASDKSIAQQIDDAVANAKGRNHEEKFENAKREHPELFKPQPAATE
jgi:phage I-like protein